MFSVFLLALALSVDAFAVAFSYGLVIRKNVFSSALKLGAATGIGQCLMPVIGWLATGSIYCYIEAFDHWIAFVVFALLGLNVIISALRGGNEEEVCPCLSLQLLFFVGVATSIDACVAGISLYFMNVSIVWSALMIGVVCMICTIFGFYASCCLKKLPTLYLQLAAGLALISLGIKVLYEHMS